MEWRDLPKDIQNLMLERQFEQTGHKDPTVFEDDITMGTDDGGGFTWEHTIEGHQFWEDILDPYSGKIDGFYEKYPKQKPKHEEVETYGYNF